MLALDRAQIDGKLALQIVVDLAEIMLQQHVLGRDGGVGFELVAPMAVGVLVRDQRRGGAIDGPVERGSGRAARAGIGRGGVGHQRQSSGSNDCEGGATLNPKSLPLKEFSTALRRPAPRIPAAVKPERMAPSSVAGKPVSVQSPASARLRQRVRAPGRRATCSGVAAKVARRSRTIRTGGTGSAGNAYAAATSRHSDAA